MDGISVLLSAYYQTRSSDVAACLNSILNQTIAAKETVFLFDGPVLESVVSVVESYRNLLAVKLLKFDKQRGLGPVLRDGMLACKYDLVARVDTDDISLPERFRLQHDYLTNHPEISVLGGCLRERYVQNHLPVYAQRSMPEDPKTLAKEARFRNPLNHPTVMCRRKAVLDSGNYMDHLWFEDYHLWSRMILAGHQMANLPDVLVDTNVDSGYFVRRGGLEYVKSELALARYFRATGFHTPIQNVQFILSRIGLRVLPMPLRKIVYRRFLRRGQSER